MNRKTYWLLPLVVLFITGPVPLVAQQPAQQSEIEGITEFTLENGLQLLLFPDDSKPTVTVNMTVLVGSRHEGYGETGMAHLLEHLVFKGTPGHKDIPKELSDEDFCAGDDVRFEMLEKFLEHADLKRYLANSDKVPVIVAGDFNCVSHLDHTVGTRHSKLNQSRILSTKVSKAMHKFGVRRFITLYSTRLVRKNKKKFD